MAFSKPDKPDEPDQSELYELLDGLPDGGEEAIYQVQTKADGPAGALPLSDEILRTSPSGDLFGMTQNAGMGWKPEQMLGPQFLLLGIMAGLRAADATPIALGYHTGHWETGLLLEEEGRHSPGNRRP